MTEFESAFAALIANEGGFTKDPNDPGNWTGGAKGEGALEGTRWGVTCAVARQHGYTGPMKRLPLSTAREIAKARYWDPYRLDAVDPRIAFQVLDTAYNGGHPARWLQRAAGATEDGIVGPKTLDAVRNTDSDTIVMRFVSYRIDYLTQLSVWPTYGKGWMHRIARNLRRAAQ